MKDCCHIARFQKLKKLKNRLMFVDYQRKIKRVFSFSSNLNQPLRLLNTLTLKNTFIFSVLISPYHRDALLLAFPLPFLSSFIMWYIWYLIQFHTNPILRDLLIEAVSRTPNHNPDSVPILPLKWGTSSWSWWCSKERSLSAAPHTFKEPQFWSFLSTFFSSEAIISGRKTHPLPYSSPPSVTPNSLP